MKKDLAISALDMAIRLRTSPSGCIFPSDRGSQYCSHDFQKKLTEYKMTPPMSDKGNYYGIAVVEPFFKSLKTEMLWRQSWPTRGQATAPFLSREYQPPSLSRPKAAQKSSHTSRNHVSFAPVYRFHTTQKREC